MKVWLIAAVAAGVGLGLGVGSTFAEFWGAQEHFHAPPKLSETSEPLDPAAGVPKVVVVNGDRFEFGTSERNVKESHNFELRNDGSAPLNVKVEHTTCKCTVADLQKTKLQPGET
ncbi:MAG TPA: DUF1573 domain-containing protein, partial [Pirellulaceae bacterium]|nr:DUF1573 domain-containing protein [Pirellulaceae bacterium]